MVSSESDMPWQQLINALGRMSGDPCYGIAEICLRIKAVVWGDFNDGVHDGGAIASTVRANEYPDVSPTPSFALTEDVVICRR